MLCCVYGAVLKKMVYGEFFFVVVQNERSNVIFGKYQKTQVDKRKKTEFFFIKWFMFAEKSMT